MSLISPVGSPAQAASSGPSIASIASYTSENHGDRLLLCTRVSSSSATRSVATVSGGGVTTWTEVQRATSSNSSIQSVLQLWLGKVITPTTGAITVTHTGSGTTAANVLIIQAFNSDFGPNASWFEDSGNSFIRTTNSTTLVFPTLTPTAIGRGYFAMGLSGPATTANSQTAGYTMYLAPSTTNTTLLYDTSVPASAQSPTATQASGVCITVAALLYVRAPRQGDLMPFMGMTHHEDELATRRMRRRESGLYVPKRDLIVCKAA